MECSLESFILLFVFIVRFSGCLRALRSPYGTDATSPSASGEMGPRETRAEPHPTRGWSICFSAAASQFLGDFRKGTLKALWLEMNIKNYFQTQVYNSLFPEKAVAWGAFPKAVCPVWD